MDPHRTPGTCPFCNQPFKYAGALLNHLEKKHPKQDWSRKWKRANSNQTDEHLDAEQEPANVTQPTNGDDFNNQLRWIFSQFPDFENDFDKLQQLED
jgi:hypothetical protein